MSTKNYKIPILFFRRGSVDKSHGRRLESARLNGDGLMRFEGRPVFAAAALFLCCSCTSPEPRVPESLGSIPDDLPLPPGMLLDPGEESWLRAGSSDRTARICLTGAAGRRDVAAFFQVHFRLARWKPEASSEEGFGLLFFRKGDERARIVLEDREGGGTRVRVHLNPEERMEGRDGRS